MQKNHDRQCPWNLESITTQKSSDASFGKTKYDRSASYAIFALTFLLCYIATRANAIALSDQLAGVFMISTFLLLIKKGIPITRSTWLFIVGLLILFTENFLFTVTTFDVKIYIKLLALCVSVIFFIQISRQQFYYALLRIASALCILSIPFYCWQIIHPQSLIALAQSIHHITPWLDTGRIHQDVDSMNIFIYTVEVTENFRNSGMFWEPGGFASFINIALTLHLMRNKFVFDKHALLLIGTMLTTFSTTGYVVLFLVLLFSVTNRMARNTTPALAGIRIFSILLLIGFFSYLFIAAPIFRDKIDSQLSAQQILIGDIDFNNENFKSLGRFGSLIVDLRSIKDKPIFGRGYSDSEFKQQFENYNFTNGLTSFIGHFGLVGFIWLIYSTYASGSTLLRQQTPVGRFPIFITLIVLTISFSNPILLTPLILIFQLHFIAQS
jgi:hypothetical protein